MTVLKDVVTRHPDDRDTLLALESYSRDAGDFGTKRLALVTPGNPNLPALIENLRRQIKPGTR